MQKIRCRVAAGFFALFTLWPAGREADVAGQVRQAQAERIGKVNFPTNCSAPAQTTMEQGLALLHSFQYQEAEDAFDRASRVDPQCALAYWGKAMALYQQLWDFPNSRALLLGRQYLGQAQKLTGDDPRIRGYIEAAAVFYQAGNIRPVARVQAYASAMERLYRDFPEDTEAGELYALSLVSLAQMGVDDLANRKKAIAILDAIFAKYPENPGAAHYLIHAADVRELAPEGLAAARAYAQIAPDSAHALHMPSHIFERLGLWQEMIDSNLASAAAASAASKERRGDADYVFHALDFLDYAYLQSGQEAKARELIPQLKNIPNAKESDIVDAENRFTARNALELHDWKGAAALPIPQERLVFQDYTYWTRAIGAARSGDLQGARAAVQKLLEIAELVKSAEIRQKESGECAPGGMAIDPREAQAWLAFAEHESERAVALLRSAADREDAQDSEPFAVPAREMLGDLLLELNRPTEALEAYQKVLRNYPNRFDALYGAARAADGLGDTRGAADFYGKLIAICPASADRSELKSARDYVATHRN